jgi:DNA ligase-1
MVKGSTGTLGGMFKKTPTKKVHLKFNDVWNSLHRIANTTGKDSSNGKEAIIVKLIQDASKEEAKFLVRFLLKTMKTGAAEKTMISALARAFAYTPDSKTLN